MATLDLIDEKLDKVSERLATLDTYVRVNGLTSKVNDTCRKVDGLTWRFWLLVGVLGGAQGGTIYTLFSLLR